MSKKIKLQEALENFLKEDSEAAKRRRQRTLEALLYSSGRKGEVSLWKKEEAGICLIDSALTNYHIMREAIEDVEGILRHMGMETTHTEETDMVRVEGKDFVVELAPISYESEQGSVTDKADREP